jgi:hypothetical protein
MELPLDKMTPDQKRPLNLQSKSAEKCLDTLIAGLHASFEDPRSGFDTLSCFYLSIAQPPSTDTKKIRVSRKFDRDRMPSNAPLPR